MDRSAIILVGGSSSRFGEDKDVLKLDNKPLLNHVVDAVKGIVSEVIVVTSSKERANLYSKMVSFNVRFVIDICESRGPLVGALTGLRLLRVNIRCFCRLMFRLFLEMLCLCFLSYVLASQRLFQGGPTTKLNPCMQFTIQSKRWKQLKKR